MFVGQLTTVWGNHHTGFIYWILDGAEPTCAVIYSQPSFDDHKIHYIPSQFVAAVQPLRHPSSDATCCVSAPPARQQHLTTPNGHTLPSLQPMNLQFLRSSAANLLSTYTKDSMSSNRQGTPGPNYGRIEPTTSKVVVSQTTLPNHRRALLPKGGIPAGDQVQSLSKQQNCAMVRRVFKPRQVTAGCGAWSLSATTIDGFVRTSPVTTTRSTSAPVPPPSHLVRQKEALVEGFQQAGRKPQ